MKQLTLKGSFAVSGKGLHSGLQINAVFNPAPENTGYKFHRTDLEGEPVIDAIAENVVDTRRGTVIGNRKGDVVSTIEHAMAALYAAGVDNCMIDVNGPELPILDGSAIEYVDKIEAVGLVEQNADKEHERHSKRHPENLHFSKENSGEYHEGVEQNRAGERHVSRPEQFDKPIHNVKNPKFNYSLKCPISWG